MTPARSLFLRLVLTSAVWVTVTLVVVGMLLALLFRGHIERRFDELLDDHLAELAAASEIDPKGRFEMTWTPSDPRFNRPHSSWYWQIEQQGKVVARSASLWHGRLHVPAEASIPGVASLNGPGGVPLRALVRRITLPDDPRPLLFVITGPIADISRDVSEFNVNLIVTLCVVGFGLISAVLAQVRFGLTPLRGLQQALAAIRGGSTDRLPESFPSEIQPVVNELNAVLDHNTVLLERARVQAGNLAHALKNPLTVIRNEASEMQGQRGEVLRDQVGSMQTSVERYLSRARAAGSAGVLGVRTPVAIVAGELGFSMDLLFKDRSINIETDGLEALYFRGDARDLEEMLGNLMDNACKWANSRVRVTGIRARDRLTLSVDDDGPGIPEADRRAVALRGHRLDQKVPGSGLGLDIVRDIATLYQGRLILGESSLGGLKAELDLPAAF